MRAHCPVALAAMQSTWQHAWSGSSSGQASTRCLRRRLRVPQLSDAWFAGSIASVHGPCRRPWSHKKVAHWHCCAAPREERQADAGGASQQQHSDQEKGLSSNNGMSPAPLAGQQHAGAQQHQSPLETHASVSPPIINASQATASSSSNTSGSVGASTISTASIPRPILIISLVSASLTMASCVFNTLLPIYLVTELKLNMRSMGMFEGALEAFSYAVRMFSGVVSDMMTSRKNAITLGFAMGTMAKFGMSGSTTVAQLFASKAVDRLANGVQAAPRDALIGDLAPAASRSACYGFASSLRKWGSFMGAGLSYLLMRASNNNYQLIFLMAASVTALSTLAFVVLVPQHARPLTIAQRQQAEEDEAEYQRSHAQYVAAVQQQQEREQRQQQQPLLGDVEESPVASAAQPAQGATPPVEPTRRQRQMQFNPAQFARDVVGMGPNFYRTLLVVCLYSLGHVNESLLEARAIEVGFGKAESALVVALLSLTVSFSAWPLGRLDDKHGPRTTFAVGMVALIAGILVLMQASTHRMALFGSLLLLGVHCAVIQGPLLSIVVSQAPANLRGTAFGLFYTLMAATTVTANTVFGTVWHTVGANAALTVSASFTLLALLTLPYLLPQSAQRPRSDAAVPAKA